MIDDQNSARAVWLAAAGVAGAVVGVVNANDQQVKPLSFVIALLTGAAAAFFVAPLISLWLDITEPSVQSGIGFVIGVASKGAVQQISNIKFIDLMKVGKK